MFRRVFVGRASADTKRSGLAFVGGKCFLLARNACLLLSSRCSRLTFGISRLISGIWWRVKIGENLTAGVFLLYWHENCCKQLLDGFVVEPRGIIVLVLFS